MPSLVIFNPPMRIRRILSEGSKFVGQLSRKVVDLGYYHADDGKLYLHEFDREPGVNMFAIDGPEGHAILIVGSEGQSLWEDF